MDDDLDAELARLEQEILSDEAAAVSEPRQVADHSVTNAVASPRTARKSTPGTDTSAHSNHAPGVAPRAAPDAVVVASKEPVVVKQQPEWQRALIARDFERMHGKRSSAVGSTPGVSIGPSLPDSHGKPLRHFTPGNAVPPSLHADPRSGASSSSFGPGGNTQNESWVWNGTVWAPAHPLAHGGISAPSPQGGAGSSDAVVGPQLPAALSSGAEMSRSQPQAQELSHAAKQGPSKQPGHARSAAGTVWVDPTMDEWPSNDFRIFVGDLAVDATEEELTDAFKKYASFNMARVVMDKRTGESKGYGFVSFAKGEDMVKALREMNGKYVGTRPVKLKKSNWQKKELTSDRKSDLKVFRSAGLIAKRRSKSA